MINKVSFFHLLRAITIIFLKIIIVVGCIVVLDVVVLGLYGLLTGINAVGMLWFVLVVESVILMLLGVAGTTVLPQKGVIGVPWSKSVRAATEEIRRDRQKQVEFWVAVEIIGWMLFFIAILSPSI